jgi:hypothetical protein
MKLFKTRKLKRMALTLGALYLSLFSALSLRGSLEPQQRQQQQRKQQMEEYVYRKDNGTAKRTSTNHHPNTNNNNNNHNNEAYLHPFPPKVPYYQLWNYTTNRIDLQPHSGPLTSLEILERVIRGDTKRDKDDADDIISDDDYYSSSSSSVHHNESSSCFVANLTRSWEVVRKYTNGGTTTTTTTTKKTLSERRHHPPFPILNLGFPKCGTTTLWNFFKCAGYRGATHSQNGKCLQEAADQGKKIVPVHPCGLLPKEETSSMEFQLDYNFGKCVYPQITLLDEFHRDAPNATFVLIFRPVPDWIRSATKWEGMRFRWNDCELPGMIKSGNTKRRSGSRKITKADLQVWWCRHVNHVREFVRQYPTHDLIELDLYDSKSSVDILTALFGGNASCWGQHNAKVRI